MNEIILSPLLKRIAAALPAEVNVYLVGGAVRDLLLGRESYDLDFVMAGNTLRIGRALANKLDGAYFPLDPERGYARIVLDPGKAGTTHKRLQLDMATFQGENLESDLKLRDFTINAMAIDVRHPQALIDPLGGAADLVNKKLRACSPQSLSNDPVRVLRAVRQSLAYDLQISPETILLMRQAATVLVQVSPERARDELFRILDGSHPRTGLEILDRVGALEQVVPEVVVLKGVTQAEPHVHDVWMHTLELTSRLSLVLSVLAEEFDPDKASNLILGMLSLQLGRYRQALIEHLGKRITPDRSLRSILFMAGLFHDSGKSLTRQVDEEGRVRFIGHDLEGEKLVTGRAQALRLSNQEIARLGNIVRHHMRPLLLGHSEDLPTRRAVYRFFRDTGEAGVDISILSLADVLATYGSTLRQEDWAHHLDVIRCLFEAWWEHPEKQVAPPTLVNGNELMSALGLEPGWQVGRLLEAIREAQAEGLINTQEEALLHARQLLVNLSRG